MQFRQKALSKLQSPEEIDLPVRFARPQGWLVLAVTVAVMVGASFWSAYGSVSSTVSVPGILTHGQGSYVLQSPVAGQVTEVLAEEGKQLPAGAPLLKVRTATAGGERQDETADDTQQGGSGGEENGGEKGEENSDTVVRTIAAGRVTALVATIGAVVTTGANVAVLERVEDAGAPLMAMLYLPAGNGTAVPEGARVDLAVQSVPAQQYGVLRGTVKAVGRSSQSAQQIAGFLGDGQLAEQFSQQGRPVPVLVELNRSSRTKSGYRWSSQDGPPFAIGSMTLATGSVHLADQRPIDWLLP
ncbi:HlyD family efflux transporter periplasmic adaptor subunit [Streptomyces sp. FIT100]|uniref:HlyD family efflux transporter periplasmic adaptor subunit n=1 Tax=Streptomyces sp. FIT100 TaxID=2837956 RepID=UPI0021C991D2|nr:HlyD family efflux transporter periplasmic adaptor subunit [Streptomyces sp. FIT100]UUN30323.1 HlyD family efflux transporter periplasmic adaptor subunit [Streptomyces sp. FIT100]